MCKKIQNLDDLLINSLEKIGENSFSENELSFLALTSKVENPIRDRWSYKLHSELQSDYLLAREWNRSDIAIIDIACPVAIIEIKAMYTFDCLTFSSSKPKLDSYIKNLNNDEEKAKNLGCSETAVYTVLLATHPCRSIPDDKKSVIKYNYEINRSLKSKDPDDLKNFATKEVNSKLTAKNIIKQGELIGGSSYGIETNVLFWLIKAESISSMASSKIAA